ncbi:response regulator [Halosquirtibacter xylanolyticus]|uniref:two-component regulator propeller domain-containing protein n=1 Tax=Halosquirtibacter xylanolyticus TaxID=3374599 RepID=UPI003747AC7A|nr:response regulator [Prolixibacteraceae bacterium]
MTILKVCRIYFFILIYLACTAPQLFAIRINRFNASQGFTRNSVSTISQDKRGIIWIGTPNGLFQYDGYQFDKYHHKFNDKNSLLHNGIILSYADSSGEMWFVTSKGLSIYNPELKKFRNMEGWPYLDITSIKEVSENHFIIGTNDGLFSAKKDSNKDNLELIEIPLMNTSLKSPLHVACMEITSDNKLIVGINRSLIYWDIETLKKDGVPIPDPVLVPNNTQSKITSVEEIPSYGYVIGTKSALYYSKSLMAFKKMNPLLQSKKTNLVVKDMVLDHKGELWIGTERNGLLQFNPRNETFTQHMHKSNDPNSIGSNHVRTMFEDHSGVLWIGTVRGGLNNTNIERQPFMHFYHRNNDPSSLSSNLIDGLCEDHNGNLWVGTFDKGINVIDFKENDYTIYHPTLPQGVTRILSVTQDRHGRIYCGSNKPGLLSFKWDNIQKKISDLQHIEITDSLKRTYSNISKIYIDSSGIFWMGVHNTKLGLVRYNPNSERGKVLYFDGQTQTNHTSIGHIVDICEDDNNDLWVATYNEGLFRVRINKKTRLPYRFIPYAHHEKKQNSISNNQAFSVMQASDKKIWVGLFGGGINSILPPKKNQQLEINHYSLNEGMPDDVIYGIVESPKGSLWISSNYGISKLNLKTKQFTNYDIEDGLQANNFRKYAYFKGRSGRVYFGGINGVTAFHPEQINKNKLKPKILITGMEVFHHKLEIGKDQEHLPTINSDISSIKDITLKHNQNTFTLNFVGLHYSSPDKNKFKYKLEGFDNQWIYSNSNRRFASYANMNPGTYTFIVTTANSDGVWADETATITITIRPPWWQTWWAYIIYATLIIASLMLFRRVILMKQRYVNKLNLERVEKDKIQEVNREKLEFFTNVSHEFKTPLTLITGPVSDILESNEHLSNRTKNDLSLIKTNADRLLRLINQLIDFRRVEAGHLSLNKENDDYVMFVSHIINSFQKIAEKKGTSLEFSHNIIKQYGNFDKDKLEKVLYNIISNAIKNTPQGGKVNVLVQTMDEHKQTTSNEIYWGVDNQLERCVEIRIVNTGSTIEKDRIPMLFERFYTNNETDETQNIFSSSGIGLTLTKGLVELHKGKLGVMSRNGETSFIIRIPLEEHIVIEDNREFTTETISISREKGDTIKSLLNEQGQENKKPLLLVVDDHQEIRDFISQILSSKYEIIEAVNGKDAYDKVMKVIPDLIISDVMMPEMDGLELCKKIKTNEITNHIPVILLTAKTAIEHRIQGIEMGADSYIPKPFNVRHLETRIEKLMELRDALQEKFKNNFLLIDKAPTGMKESDLKFIKLAENVIKENIMEENFSVESLGKELAYSRMQLYRKMKNITGLSPNEFIRNYRLKQAAKMLQEGELSVTEVLYQVGFSNKSYFTKCFKELYNETPKEYSKKYIS